jgi:hypothetical protein
MSLCAKAAEQGNLEVLKWLRENASDCDEEACAFAAGRGHLEVLKWLRSNGCKWDWHVCSFASETGQLKVLKWALENEAPVWSEEAREKYMKLIANIDS